MVCKQYNGEIRKLIQQKNILWKCYLSNGEEIWSDYNLDNKDPWIRTKNYCKNNGIDIIKVTVLVIGAPEQVVYEDKDGLDGIFIVRGIAKDILGADETIYKYMAFGLLNDDNESISVVKYYWPECTFDSHKEQRSLTPENKQLLYFKRKMPCGGNSNCQCQT